MSFSILVLCTGNVGRSPLAEVLLRARLAAALGYNEQLLEEARIEVRSAGTHAPEGMGPSQRGVELAAERGVDLSGHRSSHVDAALLRRANRIYCMDSRQVTDLREAFGVSAELFDPDGDDIPDPRGHDLTFFASVRDQIEAAIEKRLPALAAEAAREKDLL